MKDNMPAKKDKDIPILAGRDGRPLALAPITTEDALRKLLAVRPETLEELKQGSKKAGKSARHSG